jgi:hypothetical protein
MSSHHGAASMSLADEMAHKAKLIHNRLMNPPNPVMDHGINLHPTRIPPIPPDLTHVSVEISILPAPYEKRHLNVRAIAKAVCQHFHITISEIRGRSRKQRVCLPRHVIMYLCTKYTSYSLPAIAAKFGRGDHTTILHARDKVRELILVDEALASDINRIESLLLVGFYDKPSLRGPPLASISQSHLAASG